MKKYTVTVGSRRRVTVPFDAWMDARCSTLKFQLLSKMTVIYEPGVCMQKNMSYRFTLPLGTGLKAGDKLMMIPDPSHQMLILESVY